MSHGWAGGEAASYGEYMKARADGAGSGRSHLEKLIAQAASDAAASTDGASRRRVALIGDAFVDFNLTGLTRLPSWGTDVPCAGVRMLPGGSSANTARQLASLGGPTMAVSFYGAVGDDELGKYFVRALSDEGLLVGAQESLHPIEGVPQSCCTILAGPSDRAMISCYTSNERLTVEPCMADILESSPPLSLFHIGGYFNCVGLHDEAMLTLVAHLKEKHGTLITMDPQHDANETWTGGGDHLARLFPLLDVFMPNEVEIVHVAAHGAFAGGELPPVPSALPSPDEALEMIAAKYPHLLIVLTFGSQGLRAARGASERWSMPALPVQFVDATGAGDACAAGFLVQYLQDPHDIEAALRSGAAAGALSVSVAGACEQPITRDAWDALRNASLP